MQLVTLVVMEISGTRKQIKEGMGSRVYPEQTGPTGLSYWVPVFQKTQVRI